VDNWFLDGGYKLVIIFDQQQTSYQLVITS